MKRSFDKKLALNKKTVANLDLKEMGKVFGGDLTDATECPSACYPMSLCDKCMRPTDPPICY